MKFFIELPEQKNKVEGRGKVLSRTQNNFRNPSKKQQRCSAKSYDSCALFVAIKEASKPRKISIRTRE